jgi:hypothetical protein
MQAWGISLSTEHLEDLDEEDKKEIEIGREKLFLREISKKYGKMVDRGAGLDPVSFNDPQLEEASRCYLYGFYRASIVLSAAAVEMHLKRCTGTEWFDTYNKLVEKAKLPEGVGNSAQEVFRTRRRVVHEGEEVSPDKTLLILGLAKEVINHLSPS